MDYLPSRILIVSDLRNDPRRSVEDLFNRPDDEYELEVTESYEDAVALIENERGGVFEFVFIDADCQSFGKGKASLLSALILAMHALKSGVTSVALLTSRRKENDVTIDLLDQVSSVNTEEYCLTFITGLETILYINKKTFEAMESRQRNSKTTLMVKDFEHAFDCLIFPEY